MTAKDRFANKTSSDRRTMKIDALPREDNTNGWSAILPHREPTKPLSGAVSADWLVVGAGYAGLAAARRLGELRPNDSVVLADAGYVGENASGRNSGFAIDVPHNVGSSTAELEKAAQYKRLMRAGIASLEHAVDTYGIDCQWSKRGKYHCAVSEDIADATLRNHMEELSSLDEPYELLNRQQLAARVGTEYFHSGIYTPGCILLNPAALTRGLAASLPPNVSLHEASPVLEVEYGENIRAKVGTGQVRAKRLILANNAFVRYFGFFKSSTFPMISFGTLTRKLSAEQRSRLGGEDEWGVTPANAVTGATMRFTQDQRLLIRQDFCYSSNLLVSQARRMAALSRHREVFAARFPMLGDVEFEHFWMGTISITRNGAPAWGQVAPNVYAVAGCNGVGIAKQTIAGRLLAELANGEDSSLVSDMYALGKPTQLPPRPLLDAGVFSYLAKERWVGRKEY